MTHILLDSQDRQGEFCALRKNSPAASATVMPARGRGVQRRRMVPRNSLTGFMNSGTFLVAGAYKILTKFQMPLH
jgi:hypothetical protein